MAAINPKFNNLNKFQPKIISSTPSRNPKLEVGKSRGSLFKNQISKFSLKQNLKSHEIRDRAITKYGIMLTAEEIADLEKKIPSRFGGFVDDKEAKKIIKEQWMKVKEMRRSGNLRALKMEKNRLRLLKDITGLNPKDISNLK